MCNKGEIAQAHMVLDKMRERGIKPDNATLASLVYGLIVWRMVKEGY